MKTCLLIAFACLLSVSSYAQNRSKVPCNKVAQQSTAAVQDKIAERPKWPADLPPYVLVLPHVPNTYIPVPPIPEACHTYTQHSIVVKECPGTFYDNNSNIQFNGEGTYLGFYPGYDEVDENRIANPSLAPQHTVISNYNGVAPADGNSCNGCKPQ